MHIPNLVKNPLMFTQVIIQKGNMDGRMGVQLTDGRTDTWMSNMKP